MASSSSTSSKRTAMTSSESATSTIASSSSSGAGTSGGESGSGFQVPLTHDNLTFGARQEVRLKEIEKKVDEELETAERPSEEFANSTGNLPTMLKSTTHMQSLLSNKSTTDGSSGV